jgi:hypothetical protein
MQIFGVCCGGAVVLPLYTEGARADSSYQLLESEVTISRERIGQGSCGAVFAATLHGQPVAAKVRKHELCENG